MFTINVCKSLNDSVNHANTAHKSLPQLFRTPGGILDNEIWCYLMIPTSFWNSAKDTVALSEIVTFRNPLGLTNLLKASKNIGGDKSDVSSKCTPGLRYVWKDKHELSPSACVSLVHSYITEQWSFTYSFLSKIW